MLVVLVDRSMAIDPTRFLILDDIVLRLQFLEFIGNLEFQGRVGGEVVEQIV